MTLSNKDNTFRKSRNLGTLSSPLSRKGAVGTQDKIDFLKFSLTGQRSFSATLTKLKGNADLALFNGARKIVAQSRKRGRKAESINQVVGEGTFYLRVKSRLSRSSTPYRLNLFVNSSDDQGDDVTNDGLTTRLVQVATSDVGSLSATVSSDTVFLVGSNGKLSAYSKGSVKQIGSVTTSDFGLIKTYGNRAVWGSVLSNVGRELFFYDGTNTKQLTNSVSSTPEYLGIDSSRVFWLDRYQDGTNQLYMNNGAQNVLLGTNVDISYYPSPGSGVVIQGKFQGLSSDPVNTSLIWKAAGGTDGGSDDELFLFNGDTGQTVQLTANSIDDSYITNSGSNVIFKTGTSLFLYKSSAGGSTLLTSNDRARVRFTSGENVLWHEDDNQFLFNGSTIQQVGHRLTQPALSLSGSNVVMSNADGVTDTELFFYNGITRQTTQITQRPGIDPPNLDTETVVFQDGANVFWSDSKKIYVSNGITGERKELVDANARFKVIGSNALWEKDNYLFLYNSSTGATSRLNESYTNNFFDNGTPPANLLSGYYIGWETGFGITKKAFLYNTLTNTTTQLSNGGYSLSRVSGANALLVRDSDGAFFYTE